MNSLITSEELARDLAGATSPVVLDIRWQLGGPPGRSDYAEGHIPGAHFMALDTDLAGPPSAGGRHPLPEPEAFQTVMRRAGVSADREVVVYDAASSMAAARCWWLLRWAGHDRVRVLDGGLRAWTAAGFPLDRAVPEDEKGDFTVRPGGMPVLTADQAAELARSGLLLDARAAERYRGEVEPVDPVAGHIPGAVSAPTTANVDAGGRFLDRDVLAARFAALGAAEPGVRVGVYCGSGVTAAHEILALALTGVPAALYPGSWSEWSGDPQRPVATGRDRG